MFYTTKNLSPDVSTDKPIVFVDPACMACKEFFPTLATLPPSSYQIALVTTALPTEESMRAAMWHLSTGGGFAPSQGGCQSDCSTLKTILNPEIFSRLTVGDDGEIRTLTGLNLVTATGAETYLINHKVATEDGIEATLSVHIRNKNKISLEKKRENIFNISDDMTLTHNGDAVLLADMEMFPIDYLLRMARLGTNTRVLKALGGDEARTPSVYMNGKFIVIESAEQFLQMFGLEE